MLPDISSVKDGYDRWSSVYDSDGNPMQVLEGPVIQQAFGNVDGLDVLDLGCGTGRHSLHLAKNGANVTALDFSEGMLDTARRKMGADGVAFKSHDLSEPLLFPDGSFDLVVSGLVLEHLNDLALFFSEIHRVVKRGGRAVVSAMHPAMFLRGSQAGFIDAASGELVHPGSINHQLGDIVMAMLHADFNLDAIDEVSPDANFVDRFEMKASSTGWPMVVVTQLTPNR